MDTAIRPARELSIEEAWKDFDSSARAWIGLNRQGALAAIKQGDESEFDPIIMSILEFMAPRIDS